MISEYEILLSGTVVGAAALVYYMTRKDEPIDPLYDFDKQSIEIDPVEHVRVNSLMRDKPLIEYRMSDVQTIADVLKKGLEVSGNGPCLGKRENKGKGPYTWINYSDVIERVGHIGSGLINKGVKSGNETRIGIYSANRAEWIISEHACYIFSMQVVTLYDSYGKESIKYITNHADIQVMFVDTYDRLSNILINISETPSLKMVVHFDDIDANQMDELKKELCSKFEDIDIIFYEDLMMLGKENHVNSQLPNPQDVATICYTSGTTGTPKGAILSHANIISAAVAISQHCNKPHLNYKFDKGIYMSYLPFAHMFERLVFMFQIMNGGQFGFMSGDVNTLLKDVKELKPTDMPMVPRLLNRFYNQVMDKVKGSAFKSFLMNRALAAKEKDRKRGIYRTNTIYDRLVFNKIRAVFGGRIIHIASASAPVSENVLAFNKSVFSCPIPEGYGQTETGLITFTHPFDPSTGHCGPPLGIMMVKLVSVPEMGYFSEVDQGEICAKGPSMFQGYLKDEEKTKETIDKDGWLHTGDIGQWLPNGCLKIIDRKKNLFKLSQGEYISPEKIEGIYAQCPFIAQIIVEGSSLKDFTVAIIIPDPVYLADFSKKNNIYGTIEELYKNKQIRETILQELNKIGKEAGLKSYEQIRNLHLHSKIFTVENGFATATLKTKRIAVRQNFKETIESLYAEYEKKDSS